MIIYVREATAVPNTASLWSYYGISLDHDQVHRNQKNHENTRTHTQINIIVNTTRKDIVQQVTTHGLLRDLVTDITVDTITCCSIDTD